MGRLLARHLSRDFDFHVYDIQPRPREVRALGGWNVSLREACRRDLVVVCVPIGTFKRVIGRIRGLLRPGAVVMDVCSVKAHPVSVMRRLLPATVGIVATHPNFGPDSAADSLRGRQIIVCAVRAPGEPWRALRRALMAKGVEVVEMGPAEHDRRMAASLALTHFIGRGLLGFGARATGVDTEGYRRLLRVLQTVRNDTRRLFEDMNRYNAYARPMRRRFLRVLRTLDARLL